MKASALQAVLQKDPHDSVARVLPAIGQEVGATSVALFNIATGTPLLFMPTTLAAADVRRTRLAWSGFSARLLSGEILVQEQCTLIPIAKPPLALVYLGGVAILAAAAKGITADYGDFFEAAILTADHNRLTYLENTSLEQIERDKTMLLLQRNRWNYSRVAELLEITRQALYKRLKKYGVRRPQGAGTTAPE